MKLAARFTFFILLSCLLGLSFSCKKDKLLTDTSGNLEFSQDSILFDTVFTTLGSATRHFRIRNIHDQRLKISQIFLKGGTSSPFKINVDGTAGVIFNDIEIAAKDSMYVFVQVNVNPTNSNSPLIVTDELHFTLNGNEQVVKLEAWGQDAYYHKPSKAIYFKDGTYLSYSLADEVPNSYTSIGNEYVWKNDKPHVVYGYLVVDGPDKDKGIPAQKLKILENTKVYMNYRAGIWVYPGGQIQVLGKKGKEVIFQGARREKEYTDEPGQWDRIWINEGSDTNIIDYAIIKNGYIGLQCEPFGDDEQLAEKRQLTLTNTKIQNMSLWGMYCVAYRVFGANNVISSAQEHSLKILLGGNYSFIHCSFINFWNKGKVRDKPAVLVNNYTTLQTAGLRFYMGNSIVDGLLENDFEMDLKTDSLVTPTFTISNSWLKSTIDASDQNKFINTRLGPKNALIKYRDYLTYDFEPLAGEDEVTDFIHPKATTDAQLIPQDINGKSRNTANVTIGAYQVP